MEKQAGGSGGKTEMKIKRDFVTNSSSTSFIVTVKAGTSDEGELIDKFNSFREDYIKDRDWDDDFQAPAALTTDMVKQIEPGVFTIQDFTPHFGRTEDMPGYTLELFFNENSEARKALKDIGIEVVTAEIKDLNK